MKIKLSKSQWENIGKQAGWDQDIPLPYSTQKLQREDLNKRFLDIINESKSIKEEIEELKNSPGGGAIHDLEQLMSRLKLLDMEKNEIEKTRTTGYDKPKPFGSGQNEIGQDLLYQINLQKKTK